MRLFLAWLLLLGHSGCGQVVRVETGLDVLLSGDLNCIRGKRLGLVINQTAVTRDKTHIIQAFSSIDDIRITAIFTPEHGLWGRVEAGVPVRSGSDSEAPFTVYSLYGKDKKPTPFMLKDVDVMVYDIQDLGTRFYTYIQTMALCMEAAAENGIAFILLDRPDPLSGLFVEGPILCDDYKSFLGFFPIPIRYGMTPGELAAMINNEGWLSSGLKVELEIVRLSGWKRYMLYDQTGLPWIKPSPNIVSPEAALLYPGIALLEATNVFSLSGLPGLMRKN